MMLGKKGKESDQIFVENFCTSGIDDKKMEQMDEERLGGIQIPHMSQPLDFTYFQARKIHQKYGLLLCQIQNSFKGI